MQTLERGEPVDFNRIALLQSFDLAIAGRKFAEEAVAYQEAENERIKREFGVEENPVR